MGKLIMWMNEDEADETIEEVTARECHAVVAKVRSFCQQRKFNPTVHDAFSLMQNASLLLYGLISLIFIANLINKSTKKIHVKSNFAMKNK